MCLNNVLRASDGLAQTSTNPLLDILDCNYLDIDSYDKRIAESDLVFMQLNVRGLLNKQDDLNNLLAKIKHKVHVIILSETWLTPTNKNRINMPGYKLISKERATKKGGGVGFLIDENLIFRETLEVSSYNCNMEQITVEIKSNNENILLTSIYRPPNTAPRKFITEYKTLIETLNKKCKNIVIGMDHNLDFLKHHMHGCTNDFLQLNLDNELIPCINIPTRITKSSATLIDNIMISMHLHDNSDSDVVLSDISDHLPSLCKVENFHPSISQRKYIFSRAITEQKLRRINDVLNNHDWNNILSSPDVEENFTIWHKTVLKCINQIAPEKRKCPSKKHKYNPWITKGFKKSMTRKNKLYRDWIHDKTNDTKLIKYKEYKNMLQKLIRLSKVNYFNGKCYEYKNDSKKLWNLINKINGKLNDKSTIINQITIDNLLITNKQEIANKFAEFFSSVGPSFARKIGPPTTVITDYNKKIPLNKNSLYLYPTSSEEIKLIIDNMLNKNSTGYDGISNKLLKGIKNSILIPLTIIFNQSMSQGVFPNAMKEASVVPLFKAENTEILNNYRPISLLITVSKILEKLIYKRTYNFLSETDQLFVSQYGFRQNHSCNDAVNELSMQILKNLEEDKYTVSIFLDLSKAFDTLDHDILLEKKSRYGIRGHTNGWF